MIKTSRLTLYKKIIADFPEIHGKHINAVCARNVEFVSVKPGDVESNHWARKV